jgi:hypothetical protein
VFSMHDISVSYIQIMNEFFAQFPLLNHEMLNLWWIGITSVWNAKAHEGKNVFRCETYFSQMGESARDEAQWLPNALPLWELHLCRNYKCLEPWLERQTSTKLSPHEAIRNVLKA